MVNFRNLSLKVLIKQTIFLVVPCRLLDLMTISSFWGFWSSGFKAEPEPKHASADAWRSDSEVHSIAMSLRASEGRKDRCTGAEATL